MTKVGGDVRWRLTEDLSIRGVGSNAVNDGERELSLGQVFREAFVVCILRQENVGKTIELMTSWCESTSVL